MRAADRTPIDSWAPWEAWLPSSLTHHDADCCATARAWFLAMNRSLWRGEDGPAWIARRFPWGPTRWPISWCAAMAADELDCGAHAALTLEALRAYGRRALPVQLVQRQERHHLPHFHGWWQTGKASPAWAGDGVAYHEACAVVVDGAVEVWDPTVNIWLSPDHVHGLRSIAAVRIGGAAATGEVVTWGELSLPVGRWVSPGALHQRARLHAVVARAAEPALSTDRDAAGGASPHRP